MSGLNGKACYTNFYVYALEFFRAKIFHQIIESSNIFEVETFIRITIYLNHMLSMAAS